MQKTSYEMRIRDWSSDVCSSDLLVAQQCDLEVGDFVWTGGDCHLYSNHLEQVALQLSREPRPYPSLNIKRKPDSLFDYRYDDFEITGYDPHPHIKAAVAVRSEERRVGKECVSTCSTRWWPYH